MRIINSNLAGTNATPSQNSQRCFALCGTSGGASLDAADRLEIKMRADPVAALDIPPSSGIAGQAFLWYIGILNGDIVGEFLWIVATAI